MSNVYEFDRNCAFFIITKKGITDVLPYHPVRKNVDNLARWYVQDLNGDGIPEVITTNLSVDLTVPLDYAKNEALVYDISKGKFMRTTDIKIDPLKFL
jgi:hypothetical protein